MAVVALSASTQAGAAKQTQAKVTCAVSPGNTVIDYLPGQTSFSIDWVNGTTLVRAAVGTMRGGGKITVATPRTTLRRTLPDSR
jgi:hypothetical protein